jgi:diphthamide synthase (EF-2-diphthine--ammonia ligase)
MDNMADHKLLSMVQSLEEHAGMAKDLELDFVAQLIGMAVLEIKMKRHKISEREVEILCRHLEQKMEAERLGVGALEPSPQKQRRRRHQRRGYRATRHLFGNNRNRSGVS